MELAHLPMKTFLRVQDMARDPMGVNSLAPGKERLEHHLEGSSMRLWRTSSQATATRRESSFI